MDENGSPKVCRLDSLLFALTLEVVLLQLRIHKGSTDLRLSYKPANLRKTIQYEKLVRDRQMVTDVVRRTLVELAESGKWNTLLDALGLLLERDSYALCQRVDHEQLKKSNASIAYELATKRNQWAADLLNGDQKVALLRDTIKHDLLNANARLCYADKWLGARTEAQELRFQAEMKTPPIPRADHEQRVHEEITKAIQLQITEREKIFEYWRGRYSDDIVSMNARLAEKRQQLLVASTKRSELQQLYDLHAGEMRSWLSFKEQRAARKAREERSRLSAIRIQAWWRGVMVRRAIGAFKYLRIARKTPVKPKKK